MRRDRYYILAQVLVRHHGDDSPIGHAIGADTKGRSSVVIYAVAIGAAFVMPAISEALYVLVAVMWLIPDRRVVRALSKG